jgi:hypothetical protein
MGINEDKGGFATRSELSSIAVKMDAMAREAAGAFRNLRVVHIELRAVESRYLSLAKAVSERIDFFFAKSTPVDGMDLWTRPDAWMSLKVLQKSCDRIVEKGRR